MSSLTGTAPDFLESLDARLTSAAAPLKLADVSKGLPRPRKVKAADFQHEIRQLLEERVQLGHAFSHPSGKGGITRYWHKDEKVLLGVRAVDLASPPTPLPKLKTALGKVIAGTDPAFLESLLRDLIAAGRLHEHPAKTKKSGPSYGAFPPPPPLPVLAQAKHKKAIEKLAADCRKLLAVPGVSERDLFETLRSLLEQASPVASAPGVVARSLDAPPLPALTRPDSPAPEETATAPALDELILKAVAMSPVVSLPELRREMPQEFRGGAFDEAVLRLADDRRIILYQDIDPSRLSDAERAEYVQDGGGVFTTISQGNSP